MKNSPKPKTAGKNKDKKYQERLSLYPMTFEDVVRCVLKGKVENRELNI